MGVNSTTIITTDMAASWIVWVMSNIGEELGCLAMAGPNRAEKTIRPSRFVL